MDIFAYLDYSLLLKISFIIVLVTSIAAIASAVSSAKEMGGTLGQGLKKVAAGTIAYVILIATYLLLEQGNKGMLTDEQIKYFFLFVGLFGSVLLLLGYIQIYKITKKLKLFTI